MVGCQWIRIREHQVHAASEYGFHGKCALALPLSAPMSVCVGYLTLFTSYAHIRKYSSTLQLVSEERPDWPRIIPRYE